MHIIVTNIKLVLYNPVSYSNLYLLSPHCPPRFIQTMSEGLSEVGQARAWIHLALEKKMLSQHLKELLTNQQLLRSESPRSE